MADNIPLSFLVGLNIDDLKAKADEGKKKFEELGRHAEKEGAYIDALFQHLGKGFDVSTVEGKMNALRSAISDNTLTLKQWGENVDLWSKQANQAFAKGDFPLFDVINKDIVQTKGDMKDLEAETAYLIKVLQQMEESVGNISQSGSNAPRLFTTEEDYQHVKELEEEIDNLTSKLAQAGTDTEFTQINGQIIELQQELDGCNAKATEAAAALGDHLGGKAAESSTRLYELNATLAAQQKTYDDLVQKLEDVAQKMEAASAAGDVSQLKDLQLEYQHLAEQVENANNALQQTKGEQKDAAKGWEDMLGTISQLADGVETSTRPVSKAVTSFSQLSAAFKDTKNPVATFRAAMQALRGGMGLATVSVKGVISAIKALGKALLSNPFTAILMAITAITVAVIALVKSIETQAQKQKRLNEIQANYLELLQQTNQHENNRFDDAIKAKERELSIAKSANKSLAEQYRLEDELLRLKQYKANYNVGYYGAEIKDIQKNRDELLALQQTLNRVNDAKANGDKKIKITVNGKESKQKVDEAIEWLQTAIQNKKLQIRMGVDARDAKAEADAEAERIANEKKEKSKQIAATERSVLRETQSVRISLINDAYKRDIAQAKANADNKIKDLRLRLSQENNLSAAARKAINQQIKLLEQKKNNDLEAIERQHQQKLLAIRRQVEDANSPVGEQTAKQRRDALRREYERQYDDLSLRIIDPNTSSDEVEELYKLQLALRKRYGAELAILDLQIQQDEIETEKETINLRLSAVREGTLEELNLRLQLIEAERRAELQANKLKPEDQRQDEEDINAKYRRQREDEEKAFYASVIGAYADYQQEMLDMTTAFESRRAQLEQQISQERDPKKKQALQKSLAELEKTYKASLKSLQQEFIKNNIGDVFNEQTVENIKEAKRALDEMEAMSLEDFNLAYQAHLSADEFENLKEQIRKVRNELRDMSKGYSLKDAFSDAFTGKTKEEVQRGVDYIVNGFSKVASVASGIASAMREFAEATGNAKLEKMADTFDSIADTISTAGGYAAAGAQIGGGWGAVIGALLGIGQGILTSVLKSDAQREAEAKQRREDAHDYLDDVISGIGSLISSIDSLHNTVSSLDYSNYRKSLLDAINSLRADTNYNPSDNWSGLFNGANVSRALQSLDPAHLAALFEHEGGTLQGHVQWGDAWTGHGADYEKWLRAMELYNKAKNGEILTPEEIAEFRSIIGQMGGYGGSHKSYWIRTEYANQENYKDYELDLRRKALIEEMNALYEQGSLNSLEYFNILLKGDQLSLDLLRQKRNELLAQGYSEDSDEIVKLDNEIAEATYSIRERVREMFEGLAGIDVQSLANKWLDIFKEFGDNLTEVFKKIDESIDDMIKNIIYQTVFVQPLMQRLNQVIENYQRQLAQQQGIDTSQEGWQANVDWSAANFTQIAEDMRTTGHGIADLWEQVRQQLSAAGLGWGDAANDRSASARGIATASQDSVDELNGRATTIQGHTFTISENSNIIRDNTNAILGSVRQIEVYTQHLVRIDNDIHTLQITVSDLSSQGVRLRDN